MLYFFDIKIKYGVLMQKHIKILDEPIKLKRVEKWAKPLTFIRMFAYLTLRRFSGCRLYKDCFATGDFSVNAKSKEIGKELDELFAKVKTPRGFLELYSQAAYDVPAGFIPLSSFNSSLALSTNLVSIIFIISISCSSNFSLVYECTLQVI